MQSRNWGENWGEILHLCDPAASKVYHEWWRRAVTSCSCVGGCVNMAVAAFLLFVPCVRSVWEHLGKRSWIEFAAVEEGGVALFMCFHVLSEPPFPCANFCIHLLCMSQVHYRNTCWMVILLFSLALPDLQCSQGLLEVEDSGMERDEVCRHLSPLLTFNNGEFLRLYRKMLCKVVY